MFQLLRTKTTIPPARPKRVARARLIEQVHAGLLRTLTLVAAPAGFGKTTLAAEWARSGEMPVAWLTLEPADQSPERFLSYLTQAFQQVQAQIGQTALALLHGNQAVSDESILLSLLNDLSEIPYDFAIILDDYHAADCPAITPLVQFLLEHRPACLHLALISRSMPGLNLARLRALDQVVEINAADLRFNGAEIRTFLEQVMGAHLSADQLARLAQSTEGWAVGLQLAGLALARQPADWVVPAGQAHIFDYLASEVLRHESPAVQEFLKVSALFDRFCVPLCEHLMRSLPHFPDFEFGAEQTGAASLLAYIERANLFLVSLDSSGTWFRYHALFTDFLRKQPVEDVARLYRLASEWFEQNGLIDDMIHYTTHAGDFERAAGLIEANYRALLLRGEQAALLEWVHSLPPEMVAARPRLALAKGWAGVILFDMDFAASAANQAEASIPAGEAGDALRGELKALRILMMAFQGKTPSAEEFSQAFVLLSEQDDFLHSLLHFNLGLLHIVMAETLPAVEAFTETMRLSEKLDNHLVLIAAGALLGEQYQIHGELALAERTFQQIIRHTRQALGERSFLLGMPFVSYADLLREQNRFDEAMRYAEQGIAYCQVWQPMASLDGLLALGRLEAGRGDWEACFARFDQAVAVAENTKTILDDTFVVVHRVRAHLLHGDLAAAEQWISSYRFEAAVPQMYLHLREMTSLTLLRAEILRAELPPAQVAAQIAGLLPEIERRGRISSLIEGLVLHACALHAAGQHLEAAVSLNRALKLGAQGGYVRIFADEGRQLFHLIEHYRSKLDAPRAYLEKILGLLAPDESLSASQPDTLPASLLAFESLPPLTRRELDILTLLAAGKSNQEIAAERVLTLNTVKKHVSNILGKLGVANRTQAVILARNLGWIA